MMIQFFCDLVLFLKIPSVEQAIVGLVDRVLGVRIGSYCMLLHRTYLILTYFVSGVDRSKMCLWVLQECHILDRVSPELLLSSVVMQFNCCTGGV